MTGVDDLAPAAGRAPSVRRNIAALFSGELVNKITRFVAAVLLARALTLEDFGTVNVAIAVAGIATTLTSLGLSEIGARDIAAGIPPSRGVGMVLVLRLSALTLLAAFSIGACLLLVPSAVGWLLLSFGMCLGWSVSVDWVLRGRSAMLAVSTATALGGIVVLVGSAVLVTREPSVELALSVFVAGELVVAFATWWAARVGGVSWPARTELGAVMGRAWPVAVSAIMVYSYFANLDTVLLAAMRSAEDAGLYSAPYRLFLAVNVFGTFAAYALLPIVTRAVEAGDPEAARSALVRRLRTFCAYGLAILGAAELIGAELLEALFGAGFSPMRATLVVLCTAVPWYAMTFPVGYTLIGFDRNKRYLAGAGMAGALNLVLSVVLIPPLGTIGAAIATSAALMLAGVVWLGVAGMLIRSLVPLMVALAIATAGGIAAASSASIAPVLGVITVTGALALVFPTRGRGHTAG